MRESIEFICHNYLESKTHKNTKDTDIYKEFKKIELLLNNYLKNKDNKYLVKFSSGSTNWAEVPWIAIFDQDITTSAQHGFYIVFLFSADMKRIYLSLHQGFTHYHNKYGMKNSIKIIKEISEIWRDKLLLENSYLKNIDLASKSKLPRGYTASNIGSLCYQVEHIPNTNEIFKDLDNLLFYYNNLKKMLINNSAIITNNKLIADKRLAQKQAEDNTQTDQINEIILSKGINCKLIYVDEFPDCVEFNAHENEPNEKFPTKTQKTDYVKKQKKNQKIGLIGEYFVLNCEREKLKKLGINKNVIHMSIETNDAAKYDILSYDENGNELYIEVKSTLQDINTAFYISSSELEFSKQNADHYCLYRVYDINIEQKTGKFYTVKGNLKNIMNARPTTYIISGFKEVKKIIS